LPLEKLPPFDLTLIARVEAITPNNERTIQEFSFSSKNQLEEYLSRSRQDTLEIYYRLNETEQTSDSVFVYLTDRYYNEQQIIHTRLPYSLPNIDLYSNVQVTNSKGRPVYYYTTPQRTLLVEGKK